MPWWSKEQVVSPNHLQYSPCDEWLQSAVVSLSVGAKNTSHDRVHFTYIDTQASSRNWWITTDLCWDSLKLTSMWLFVPKSHVSDEQQRKVNSNNSLQKDSSFINITRLQWGIDALLILSLGNMVNKNIERYVFPHCAAAAVLIVILFAL